MWTGANVGGSSSNVYSRSRRPRDHDRFDEERHKGFGDRVRGRQSNDVAIRATRAHELEVHAREEEWAVDAVTIEGLTRGQLGGEIFELLGRGGNEFDFSPQRLIQSRLQTNLTQPESHGLAREKECEQQPTTMQSSRHNTFLRLPTRLGYRPTPEPAICHIDAHAFAGEL